MITYETRRYQEEEEEETEEKKGESTWPRET